MIIVDSSVWIDFFNGKTSREVQVLEQTLADQLVGIGDLILAEVLQGFRVQRDYDLAEAHLRQLICFDMCGKAMALQSAYNYRWLRSKGITIRKTIDLFIGTFCIEHGHVLLHSDRDFDFMATHLNLQVM